MADLKEDIAIIFSSAIAGVGAFLSWFYQSGLLGTVTGIVIGAGITYFVQTRTQNRTWKREYTIKTTEQVYGELFGEIKNIARYLESDDLRQVITQGKWSLIQNDHRYFMVDQKFREKIDQFYSSLDKYNSAINGVENRIVHDILKKCAKDIFNKQPRGTPRLSFFYTLDKSVNNVGLLTENNLLNLSSLVEIEQKHLQPSDQMRVTKKRFMVSFDIINDNNQVNSFEDDNDGRVSAYWSLCLQSLKENETFTYVSTEKQNLLKQAADIKKSLENRISEPWKI